MPSLSSGFRLQCLSPIPATCPVLFYVMGSQEWPQEEMQQVLRKTKPIIILICPEHRRHGLPHSPMGKLQGGLKAESTSERNV